MRSNKEKEEIVIDNFELIRKKLNFTRSGDFYFIQVIKRRKDNPGLERSEKCIRDYFVGNLEDFDATENSIRRCCEENNARAYIRLNRRNEEVIALKMLSKLAEYANQKSFEGVHRLYQNICGLHHAETVGKTWVVDLDTKDEEVIDKHLATINRLQSLVDKEQTNRTLFRVPTLHGVHLICSPFNRWEYEQEGLGKEVDIHKDNPTLLYFKEE